VRLPRRAALLAAALALAGQALAADRPEPGLQGQSMPGETGAVLPVPYSKGVTRIGHEPIRGRDSNVQLAWAGTCAYVSSTGGPFPIIGIKGGDAALLGTAVIDVRNPRRPRLTRILREPGALSAAEAIHAVDAPGRKVLAVGNYFGGPAAAGTSGGHDPHASQPAWLAIYDLSNCANPRLMAQVQWPENAHSLRISPDGRLVYGTQLSPFDGKGGVQVMDISDMARPRFLGKFGATRPDGSTFEFASHELSFSADGRRVYAGVNASQGGDLNRGITTFPPNKVALGPEGGGIYIFDNSDFADRRPDPKLRLISAMPGGGWHSVMPARIGGVPYLVGGSELGACPGTWPRFTNIADETRPFIAGEFRLAMNRPENCPPPGAASGGSSGIVPDPGSATLHFNDVDSANDTRLGLFNFMWAGLRIVDIRDATKPAEIGYFKPGDVCTGHVRYAPKSRQIWLVCNASGFHVLALD
jgi:hypothetical protein